MPQFDRRRFLALSAAVSASAMLPRSSAAAEPLRIGCLFNLTGSLKAVDEPAWEGAQTAAGLVGRPLELVLRDGRSDPAVIAAQTESLAADPTIAAAIGFCDNDAVLAAMPALARHRLALVTPGATSPALHRQSRGLVFLACFTDAAQAAAAAQHARGALGLGEAAVIVDEGETFTRLLADYFRDAFQAAGGTVTGMHPYRGAAFEAAVSAAGRPPLVFAAAMAPEIGPLVRALRTRGVTGPVLGGDSCDHENLLAELGDAPGELIFTTHAWLAGSRFAEAYRIRHGHPPASAFAAVGHDAVRLVAAAAALAPQPTRDGILAALPSARLDAGASGAIAFQGGDGNPRKTVFLVRAAGGRLSLADALVPA